jgi:hypothetical protein
MHFFRLMTEAAWTGQDGAMTDDEPQPNHTKVRQGLAIIVAVVLIAVVGFFLIDAPVGKAMMVAVAFTAAVRAFIFTRSLRQGD